MLDVDDFYGQSKNIDIAKGVNKIPTTFKDGWKQRKRLWQKK